MLVRLKMQKPRQKRLRLPSNTQLTLKMQDPQRKLWVFFNYTVYPQMKEAHMLFTTILLITTTLFAERPIPQTPEELTATVVAAFTAADEEIAVIIAIEDDQRTFGNTVGALDDMMARLDGASNMSSIYGVRPHRRRDPRGSTGCRSTLVRLVNRFCNKYRFVQRNQSVHRYKPQLSLGSKHACLNIPCVIIAAAG